MLITCPECQFSREINEKKIPERSVVATCPKCKAKFKFRELPEEEESFILEKPEQEIAPTPEKEQAPEQESFPRLHDPAEDPGDELWSKIGDMSPPREQKRPADSQDKNESPLGGAPLHEGEDKEPERPVIEVPFEKLDEYGFFPGIFATIKRVLFAPSLFFSVMPLGRKIVRPLVFALLILVLHDILVILYPKAGLLPPINFGHFGVIGPETEMSFIYLLIASMPFARTIALFILAGLFHLILFAFRGANNGFEATFRVVAYSYTPYIFSIVPIPFSIGSNIQAGLITLWGMIIMIIGLKCLHRTQYIKAVATVLIPFLFFIYLLAKAFMAGMPTV